MVDDAAERERLRRKAFIERVRKENDEAPRPTLSGVQQAKVRAHLFDNVEEGNDDFAGIAPSDMSDLQRQGLLDQARRAAAGETKASGEIIHKTFAPPRELANERQPVDEEFTAAEAPQPTAAADADVWADWNRWCDARIEAALAAHRADVGELAGATRTFAENVDARMVTMQTLLNQLTTKLELLRERYDRIDRLAPTDFSSRRVN